MDLNMSRRDEDEKAKEEAAEEHEALEATKENIEQRSAPEAPAKSKWSHFVTELDISREDEEGDQDEVYLLELPKKKSGVSRRSWKRKIGDINGINDRKTINKDGNSKRSCRVPSGLQQTSGLVAPSPLQIQTPA